MAERQPRKPPANSTRLQPLPQTNLSCIALEYSPNLEMPVLPHALDSLDTPRSGEPPDARRIIDSMMIFEPKQLMHR